MSERNTLDRSVLSNVSAAVANAERIYLKGGKYYVASNSTGTGTIDLQRLAADGSTWTAQITQITATAGKQTIDLPDGLYRWVVDTFTANYLEIVLIPYAK